MTTQQNGIVQRTTDYSIFKAVVGNREIYEPHLNRLRRSIAKKNMLAQNPIIVSQDMRILDGQHRLKAAQELGEPIYYTIVSDLEDSGLMEIQLLNANNRSWLTSDYLESYIAMGKKNYIELDRFAKEYRISVPLSIMILSNRYSDHATLLQEFREGKFEIEDYKKAENMASLIVEIRKHSPDYAWAHRQCIKALAIVQDTIDPKLLTSQLERYQLVITRRNSVKEYLRQFENILKSGGRNEQISFA